MKLLHFSDTHLGFSEYHKIDPKTGINQREQDFYDAWNQVIVAILEEKPDVVVHAGDLFHTPRPSNRAIHVALEGVQKLNDAGIPLVIIAGNHETPRIRTTGSIFESLNLFENIFAAFQNKYEKFKIVDTSFHCVPHCSLTEEMDKAFSAIKTAKGKNVLVTHGAWTGKETYGMGEFNEQRLPDVETVQNIQLDYIALGHYHRFLEIKDHVCYSGSTERTSLNEHNSTCGYLVVNLETGDKKYHEIKSRPMIKLDKLDCNGLSSSEIYSKIILLSESPHKDAIVQLSLVNVEQQAFLSLDVNSIDDLFEKALHLEKTIERKIDSKNESIENSRIDSLPVEFQRFMGSKETGELDTEKLLALGVNYLTDTDE